MAGPSAGGIDATQAGPAGGANAREAGASAGNRVPPGADAPAAFPQSHVNLREQDLLMPVANVIRIMRRVLPMNAKVSNDAREMIQECVSEYINLITAEANERCKLEKRKTITANDVIWAMGRLGFDSYVGPLRLYLRRALPRDGEPPTHRPPRGTFSGPHEPQPPADRGHQPHATPHCPATLNALAAATTASATATSIEPRLATYCATSSRGRSPWRSAGSGLLPRDVWGWGWFMDKQFRGSTNALLLSVEVVW